MVSKNTNVSPNDPETADWPKNQLYQEIAKRIQETESMQVRAKPGCIEEGADPWEAFKSLFRFVAERAPEILDPNAQFPEGTPARVVEFNQLVNRRRRTIADLANLEDLYPNPLEDLTRSRPVRARRSPTVADLEKRIFRDVDERTDDS